MGSKLVYRALGLRVSFFFGGGGGHIYATSYAKTPNVFCVYTGAQYGMPECNMTMLLKVCRV